MSRSEVMAAAAGALVMLFTSGANAQSAPAAPAAPSAQAAPSEPSEPSALPAPASQARAIDAYTGPNRAVIGTGILSLLIWYVPGVAVASGSRIDSDSNLFIPLVGPWLDLGDRPLCGAGSVSCRSETVNKVLLVADGVFQAWGVGAIIAGLIAWERPPTTASVRLAPVQVGLGGYGMAAVGRF